VKRPCLRSGCGALSDGSYCPKHRPARTGKPRPGNGWQATRWRRKVLALTGGSCIACGSNDRVQAHHLHPLADGGKIDGDGVPLCAACHTKVSKRAASARAQQNPNTG